MTWSPATCVESASYLRRIDELRGAACGMRFVSFEPLLGPVGRVDMDRIDWAIMGGASGSGYRRVGVTDLAPWREAWGAPVFFKVGRPGGERLLDGIRCDAYPAVAAPPPKPLKLLPGAPPGDSLLGDLL